MKTLVNNEEQWDTIDPSGKKQLEKQQKKIFALLCLIHSINALKGTHSNKEQKQKYNTTNLKYMIYLYQIHHFYQLSMQIYLI